MSKTPVQLKQVDSALAKQLGSFVDLPKIDAPFTTVVGRAQVTDLSKDLMPRLGIERIMIQSMQWLQSETGPNMELVYKPTNDIHDQFRFVGNWVANNDVVGARLQCSIAGSDFFEVSFYGTGVNLLSYVDGNQRVFEYSVDGGGFSNTAYPPTTPAALLASKNYAANCVIAGPSGLALGLHTVKFRYKSTSVSTGLVYGVEILNESTLLKTSAGSAYAGSRKSALSALDSQAYNSSFASGTLGTRGGRVITYIQDGQIKKAVNPAGSQLNLASADHSNEEAIRTYHFREFGVGRADDFSTLITGSTSREFTLDDGTTTLSGNSIQGGTEAIELLVNSTGRLTFQFVGTGFDVITDPDAAGSNVVEYFVDGISVGQFTNNNTDIARVIKIVSGLPYGSHTVSALRISATATPVFRGFITYSPAKPAIPDDAVALADYCIVADLVGNTTQNFLRISTGVIRKVAAREWVAADGTGGTTSWQIQALSLPDTTGFIAQSDRTGAYAEYTFFGTGAELRFQPASNRSANITVTLNGIAATAANFPTATFTPYGTGVAYTTNTLDMQDAVTTPGAGFRISGLPLGKYTIRFTNNTASSYLLFNCIDIITPIHSPKYNLPGAVQGALNVGSNAIGDIRNIPGIEDLDIPNWAQAVGVITTPTNLTGSGFIPLPDMFVVIKTSGRPVEMTFMSEIETISGASNTRVDTQFYVDGIPVGAATLNQFTTANQNIGTTVMNNAVVALEAGVHIIAVYWTVTGTGATGRASGTSRILTAKEI